MIRRRVGGQQHCTSLGEVVTEKTAKASNVIPASCEQTLQRATGALLYSTCKEFVTQTVLGNSVGK